jgi:tetratricopeptide (TPR) repeat protein
LKAFISILVTILVIGAVGFMISGKTGGSPISESSQALSLCKEGTADLNAYRLNAAREKLEASLELDPNLAEASISLAFTLARLGREDEYKAALARSDSLVTNITDPDRRMMTQLRLSATRDSKFYSIRDSLLARLQVEKPNNIHVLVTMAEKRASIEERIQAWEKILEVDPNFANAYNMLGYMALYQGKYDLAIEHMQKYAFLAPDLANPHDSMGDVYFAMGRYEDAESEYVKSVTMQPDFYASLINLGRTYLARGQINKGVDILEKVRTEIAGSTLEQKVDQQIVETLIIYDLEDKVSELTANFVVKWPENGSAAFYRAMRLAYMGKFPEGQAVMDSALAMWRVNERYKDNEEFRQSIDRSDKRYQALVSDLADTPSTRIRHWASVVAMNSEMVMHEQWYDRWRLGEALLDNNQPELAMEQITPVLEINPRLINPLILAIKASLAQRQPELSRQALEQAKWALSQADPDFPPLLKVQELEKEVAELEGSS